MSQSVAVIIGAVVTGLFTLLAAFVAKTGRSAGPEGGRSTSVWLLVAVTVCAIVVFSLMIGVVGIVYENNALKGLATITGVCSGIAAFFVLLKEMERK
jgi:Mn2+/Fe2+ NRAMP family transporter